MDNDGTTQQATAPAPEPEQPEQQTPFSELSDDDQQDVIREAFFGNVKDADGTDDEADTGDDGAAEEAKPAEDETPKETTPAETTPAGETALYTPEEFLLLSPDEVDASRLPDAARIVHERDMRYYNETIKPQLEELRALKARQAQPVAQQQTPQAEPQNAADGMKAFNDAVKKEAARRLGVDEIDEFNVDHQIQITLVAGEYQRQAFAQQEQAARQQAQMQSAQQNYATVMGELQQEYGSDFGIIDRWALAEMNNLPYKVVNSVMADLKSGDPARIKAVYKNFADRYKAAKNPAPAKPQKAVAEPPRLINGSSSGDTGNMSWGMKEWKSADADTKVRMLQETFFKDK